MHIHLLGISGTFMSGLALLAKEAGFEVTGCDAHCYPPVSTLLQEKNITWHEGYEPNADFHRADLIIVGNAMKRGMPIVEAMLSMKKNYTSGPAWLSEHVLKHRRVIAIAGTHGKTATTCMVSSILDSAGLKPGFLIGGVSPAFQTNARLGEGEWFVIEADEYDSAFFDKRPKFIHYHPEIAILNNLEFDHADIYQDLASIEKQFHFLLRTIPAEGLVLTPKHDEALCRVIQQGCYSQLEQMEVDLKPGEAHWQAKLKQADGGAFQVSYKDESLGEVHWNLIGDFNVSNGLAAFAAAYHAGVPPKAVIEALDEFIPVKRRLECRGKVNEITVYDDFAHHPTAIEKTLKALKATARHKRIWVALEFASFTMKTGVHAERMEQALACADEICILNPSQFDLARSLKQWRKPVHVCASTDEIIATLSAQSDKGDAILVMSNRGFDNLHTRLLDALK